MARAGLRASHDDFGTELIADLDAVDRAAPKGADARARLGDLYQYAGQPAAAIDQYSKWIDSHNRDDVRMPSALNSRCWTRALAGLDLDQALADCNSALRLKSGTAAFLDSRGLVYLRQGNYDRSIADYDASLRLQPKNAWSLYGLKTTFERQGMADEAREAEKYLARAWSGDRKRLDLQRL